MENDKLDEVLGPALKQLNPEKPSLDFTDRLMDRIEEARQTSTVYTPLISKQVWVILFGLFALFLGFAFMSYTPDSQSWMPAFDLSLDRGSALTNWSFSPTYVYLITFLAAFVLVQLPMMKYYLDKRVG